MLGQWHGVMRHKSAAATMDQTDIRGLVTTLHRSVMEAAFYGDSLVKSFLVDLMAVHGYLLSRRTRGRPGDWEMHPDPRSGYDERSSQCPDELLSVQGVNTLHLMLHAREDAMWDYPSETRLAKTGFP